MFFCTFQPRHEFWINQRTVQTFHDQLLISKYLDSTNINLFVFDFTNACKWIFGNTIDHSSGNHSRIDQLLNYFSCGFHLDHSQTNGVLFRNILRGVCHFSIAHVKTLWNYELWVRNQYLIHHRLLPILMKICMVVLIVGLDFPYKF